VLSIGLGNGKALKRDTFASLIIAAGVNAKALSVYRGTHRSRSHLTDTGI
jgi:hypothetical protein